MREHVKNVIIVVVSHFGFLFRTLGVLKSLMGSNFNIVSYLKIRRTKNIIFCFVSFEHKDTLSFIQILRVYFMLRHKFTL